MVSSALAWVKDSRKRIGTFKGTCVGFRFRKTSDCWKEITYWQKCVWLCPIYLEKFGECRDVRDCVVGWPRLVGQQDPVWGKRVFLKCSHALYCKEDFEREGVRCFVVNQRFDHKRSYRAWWKCVCGIGQSVWAKYPKVAETLTICMVVDHRQMNFNLLKVFLLLLLGASFGLWNLWRGSISRSLWLFRISRGPVTVQGKFV